MCGIAGILGDRARDQALIERMTDRIVHRGPDDSGAWIEPDYGVALGHRRLSIVDLGPAGHEPMHSASGRLVVTYNGEIYNHAEIRAEIDQLGRTPPGGWRGHSDIETFLEAIDHWGLEKALDRAVGMFAFALWDRSSRVLRLVRDRFGEKPLYYGWAGRDFVFASELKALAEHPDFDRTIDREALAAYFAHLYVPAPRSIYRGVFKLPPGCILTIAAGARRAGSQDPPAIGEASGALRIDRYWDYAQVVRAGAATRFQSREEALDAIDRDLATAIKGQSIADVPVGAFLSGGIDSSTIVALYQKHSNVPVRTFSIGFEEAGFDEARYAKEVAAHLRTVHHEHYVTAADALAVIPGLPQIYDEPFADSSQIPTFLVSQFARGEVTVALTGDGGDEMFGGYYRHFMIPRLWRKVGWLPLAARRALFAPLGRLPAGLLAVAGAAAGSGSSSDRAYKIRKAFSLLGNSPTIEHFAAAFLAEDNLRRPLVAGLERDRSAGPGGLGPDSGLLDQLTYLDATTYLPDDILCKVDRASMAVSLETRVPFLDHRLAATAARVPEAMKISGTEGKLILKSLLGRHVPPAMTKRPKAGFAIPLDKWLRGPLAEWSSDLLSPARIARQGLLDGREVNALTERYRGGEMSILNTFWALLMFEAWAEI